MGANDERAANDFRIAVVDDEVPVLEVITEILRGAGWTVDAFTSPAEAMRLIKKTPYDALVLDLYMPELPGLLFHSKLKFIDRELWGRTVFVSGHFSTDDLRRSLEGTARFVQKPFKAETLVGTVGMALPQVSRAIADGVAPARPDPTPVRS